MFSLGAVLYEMAAGRRAFDGRSDAAILDSVLNRAPAPVLQLNPSMPPGLGDVIAKALEKDPEARYQNGADLRAELKRLEREIDSLRMTRTLPMHGGDSPVKEPNQPARLGRYQLIGRLGAGAMGTVYEGIDPIIGRSVAIKTILQNRLGSHTEAEQLRERLLREARAAGSLTHPNIVTVFDAGEKAGVTYIVMALICGSTLDAALTGKPYTGAHVIWTGGCRSNPRPPPGNCQNPGVKPFAFSGSGNRSVLFWTAVKNDCDRETQRREA